MTYWGNILQKRLHWVLKILCNSICLIFYTKTCRSEVWIINLIFGLTNFLFLRHYIYIRGPIRTFPRRRCFISKFIHLRACINCNYVYWEIAWKWKLFFFVLYFTSSLMRWERVSWQVHAYILMATAFREITLFETKS